MGKIKKVVPNLNLLAVTVVYKKKNVASNSGSTLSLSDWSPSVKAGRNLSAQKEEREMENPKDF